MCYTINKVYACLFIEALRDADHIQIRHIKMYDIHINNLKVKVENSYKKNYLMIVSLMR